MVYCITQEFKAAMKEALDTEKCPLDSNLEKVIPGLHLWHKENNFVLKKLDKRLSEGLNGLEQKVDTGFNELVRHLRDDKKHSDDRIADMFVEMGMKLKAGNFDVRAFGSLSRKRPRLVEDELPALMGHSKGDVDSSSEEDRAAGGDSTINAERPSEDHPWNHTDHSSYTFTVKHSCLKEMYDEWYGLGNFFDTYGGVEGREVLFGKHKAKWRRHLDNNHFSRTARLVKAVVAFAQSRNISHYQACEQLDPHYQESKQSLTKTVQRLQDLNLLVRKKNRGQKGKANNTTATVG